jgi:glycosyltransferase involved in cell wall biosynthesis
MAGLQRYVVLARDFDFAEMARQAANDESPKHILADVRDRLNAQVIAPSTCRPPNIFWKLAFQIAARGYSTPQVWAIAHHVAKTVQSGDLVYATGEDVGLAICVLAKLRGKLPKVVVSVVWPERVAPLKLLLRCKGRVRMLLAVTQDKARQIRMVGGPACPPVVVLPAVIDLTFFSPSGRSPRSGRPLIVSGGLVDRDYVTLAKAAEGLPVAVEVCAMSSMPSSLASPAYPANLPDNMLIGQQSLRELRDMYRAATLVVVPLVASNQGSGLTVVWEAMATGCPIIATRGAGDLAEYADNGLVIGVPAEDPAALRAAIEAALADPEGLQAMAERAHKFVSQHFNDRRYVDLLAASLIAAENDTSRFAQSNAKQESLPIA